MRRLGVRVPRWALFPLRNRRSPAGPRGRTGPRMKRQDQRRQWRLVEVEVAGQVAQDRTVLTYVGARVRAPVRTRVKARPTQEVVFDELVDRVKAQRLVVDEPGARVRA